MPIPVICPGCSARFRAPDRGAGKTVPCPKCQTKIVIPKVASPAEGSEPQLAKESTPPLQRERRAPAFASQSHPAPVSSTARQEIRATSAIQPALAGSTSPSPKSGWVPPTSRSTPGWLRYLHWCLALAMIPLAISIVTPDESTDELADRVAESFDDLESETTVEESAVATDPGTNPLITEQGPAPQVPYSDFSPAEEIDEEEFLSEFSVENLLYEMPDHKLEGALLSRDSYAHWLFALLAVTGYMTFLVFLASDRSAKPLHLLGIGLFTATGGIALLFLVQLASTLGVIRVRGAAAIFMLVIWVIGLSYSCALSSDSGLILSFIGFTFGVGLCEELCKALPILVFYHHDNKQSWRGAFLWGLASGTGFGVSEGIMYSRDFYNGIAGLDMYLVRFVSCVALHAIWAGSIGIAVNQRKDLLREAEGWLMYVVAVLRLIAVPMVLHGLYDTLLKKEYEILALATAAASFGFLAWQISRLRTIDDVEERAAYVAKYIRSKAALKNA